MLTNPHVYPVGGKDVLMATVVAPIKPQGKFLGMVAIDLSLETFAKMNEAVTPLGNGHGYIIPNDGFTVAHPIKEVVGKNIKDTMETETATAMMEAIQAGKVYKGIIKTQNGKHSLQFMVPIKVRQTTTPWSMGVSIPMETILDNAVSLRNTSIIIGLSAILILFGVVFYITQSLITRPLNRVVRNLTDMAKGEGDLTMRLPVNSKDEIGKLSSRFNTFLEKLHDIIKELADRSTDVDTSSSSLLAIAGELSGNAKKTTDKSGAVSTSVKTMSADALSSASTMEEAAVNINMVAASADEMASTIREIANNSENARSISENAVARARETAGQMEALGTAATDIGNVTEAISDISGEIKQLADQTAIATQDIKNQVASIQNVTGNAVSSIGEITDIISRVNDIVVTITNAVEEQSTATNEIAANIAQASQGIQDVNTIISCNSTATMEMSRDTTEVSGIADKMSASAKQVHENAGELSDLAAQLKKIVDTFKIYPEQIIRTEQLLINMVLQ